MVANARVPPLAHCEYSGYPEYRIIDYPNGPEYSRQSTLSTLGTLELGHHDYQRSTRSTASSARSQPLARPGLVP
jgi:hypothetical protein